MTFLVVDDDPDDRLLISDALKESGNDVAIECVCDGEEMLQYLRRSHAFAHLKGQPLPSVILLDLNMPRKSGAAALSEMKEDPDIPQIPVVVLTTSSSVDDVDKLYELGASSFITKPSDFEHMCELGDSLYRYWKDFVTLPSGIVRIQ